MNLDYNKVLREAVISEGNVSRLLKVFDKARRGESVTVGAIGGSITQGAHSTKKENQYIQHVGAWFKQYFKNDNITVVNAGIGATNSMYGIFRCDRDFLSKGIDVAIIDFCCNDFFEDETAMSDYEAVIRKILTSEKNPPLVAMSFTTESGDDTHALHHPTSYYYNLPMISYGRAVRKYLNSGELKWSELSPDTVHPNDFGHKLAADMITAFFESVDKSFAGERGEYVMPEKVLNKYVYNAPRLVCANGEGVTELGGFEICKTPYSGLDGYKATSKQPITFKLKCEKLGISFLRWNTYTFGKASVTVDGKQVAVLDGHFPVTWGGFLCTKMLATDLENKEHEIKIQLCEEKAEKSTGEEFMFCYLLAD